MITKDMAINKAVIKDPLLKSRH